ncbi:hypothetical protein EXU57_17135 [Segetibacter sp. 3557_3]|uniref:FG-GAP-like repeat-containing protein n=1 Tax=Segetibacter sp. 3557_3 TaxID=2547429 RepID=UPI001058DD14|nr:FG-GAP-like repeat-containing protein [Segetibacter sp. 3557_3]TDH23525.1 hypothetical protein EXU57_17135 [Segetibacter sp. 3557_3]
MNIQTLIKCYLCCLLQSFAVDGWSQPQVTAFSPDRGPVGTPVTITGHNFNPDPARNIVYFGAVRALVTAATTTSLTVTAPAGATYKPLTVTDQSTGLTAYSKAPFSITFTNPFAYGIPANFYQPKVSLAQGNGPIAIADIDGDGKPDLVTLEQTTITLRRNISAIGSNVISAASLDTPVSFPIDNSNYSRSHPPAIGDVNGDGKLDIVVASYGSFPTPYSRVSVLRNTSTPGSITASSMAAKVDFNTATLASTVELSDIDGDGRPELVVLGGFAISILHNTSTPGTINSSSFAGNVDFSGVYPSDVTLPSVEVSDLDGDGKPDMVVNLRGAFVVFRNNATVGSIGPASFQAPVNILTADTRYLAISDMDGDGKPDLVGTGIKGTQEGFFGTVSIIRNIATPGNLTPASFEPPVSFFLPLEAWDVTVGDLDGDAKPDVAVGVSPGNTISVFRNTATPGSINAGSLAGSINFPGNRGPISISDVDADGKPELFFMSYPEGLSVYKIDNPDRQITFNGKVLLQGAYNPTSGLMATSLNSSGILKSLAAHQPYSTDRYRYAGTEKVDPTFFDAHPDIVDWVLVELRSATTPTSVLATRAAFVKQNGTLIDINGVDAGVTFQGFMPGNYHIAIRHRNHLGIRSALPVDFSSGSGNYDFTTGADKSFQNQAYTSTVLVGNAWAMRAGDANTNGNVRYSGPANDQNQLLNNKLGGSIANLITSAYAPEDLNMDGTIKYNGPANDQNFLLNTILAGLLSTVYVQQL